MAGPDFSYPLQAWPAVGSQENVNSNEVEEDDGPRTHDDVKRHTTVSSSRTLASDYPVVFSESMDAGASAGERCGRILKQTMKRAASSKTTASKPILYEDSLVGRVAASRPFEYTTLFVISANAVWLGIDTDYHNQAQDISGTFSIWTLGENIFCTYFTIEILIRFFARKPKGDLLRDYWFLFDTVLVLLMITETWVLPIILSDNSGSPLGSVNMVRLFRLLRLSRLARLMRQIPELQTIVKGIMAALRSVFTVLCLLVALCYVFAIIFTGAYQPSPGQTYSENQVYLQGFFGSIGISMITLIDQGTFLDELSDFIYALRQDSLVMLAVFFVFVLITSFTVLNMLIGILCDVVTKTTDLEIARVKQEMVRDVLSVAFTSIDRDNSGQVSKTEFDEMCRNRKVLSALESKLRIDTQMLSEARDLLFTSAVAGEEVELSFDEFTELLIRMRPEEKAGNLDIQQFRKALKEQETRTIRASKQLDKQLHRARHLHQSRLAAASAPSSAMGSKTCSFTTVGSMTDLDAHLGLPFVSNNRSGPGVYPAHPAQSGALEKRMKEFAQLCAAATVAEIAEELAFRELGCG